MNSSLEVRNYTKFPIRVRLFLSKTTDSFYLDIYRAAGYAGDGTRIETKDSKPVPIEVKNSA